MIISFRAIGWRCPAATRFCSSVFFTSFFGLLECISFIFPRVNLTSATMKCGGKVVVVFVVILALLKPSFQIFPGNMRLSTQSTIRYTPAMLKSLRPTDPSPSSLISNILPSQARKRGRKGGVRARLRRRPFKPPLPSIVMGNARSLNNKIDELAANTRYLSAYREAGIVCITETWLHDTHPDSCFEPDGFKIYRGDRTKDSGKKHRWRSVCSHQQQMVQSKQHSHNT